jgi:hypothetical protein
MRGIIGLILAGLGAFLILVAVLLPTWVVGHIMKFPLNEYQTATLQAANASYFSAKTYSVQTGVTMQATYTIKGDASAGNSSTAVWNEFSWVEDITHHQSVQSQSRTLAFDRRTAQLVDCSCASVNGNKSIRQSGVAGYVFPFNTQKQTYQVFDTTLDKPMPFVYSGTASVSGIQTYEFVESYGPTQTGTSPFLGKLVGSSSALVVLPEYNALHLIYYIDPETGALVDVNEHQTTTLRNPANGESVTVFDADLIVTPASLATIVGLDNNGRNEIALLGTILPIATGIVGFLALVAGVFLGRRRRDEVAPADAGAPAMAMPEMAVPEATVPEAAVTEPPRGRHAARDAAIVPGLDGEAQAPAGDAPDSKNPDAGG